MTDFVEQTYMKEPKTATLQKYELNLINTVI